MGIVSRFSHAMGEVRGISSLDINVILKNLKQQHETKQHAFDMYDKVGE